MPSVPEPSQTFSSLEEEPYYPDPNEIGLALSHPDKCYCQLPKGDGRHEAALPLPMSTIEGDSPAVETPEHSTEPTQLQDIPSWLRSLHLHKYTESLKDLKWSELVELDDQALEKRGVTSRRARQKMLKVFEQMVVGRSGPSRNSDSHELVYRGLPSGPEGSRAPALSIVVDKALSQSTPEAYIGPREATPSVPTRLDDANVDKTRCISNKSVGSPEGKMSQPGGSSTPKVWTYPSRPNLGRRHRFEGGGKPEQEEAKKERRSKNSRRSLTPPGPEV